jgi:hypothetical protein
MKDGIQIAQQHEALSLFAVVAHHQTALCGPVRVCEGGDERDLDAGETRRGVRPPVQIATTLEMLHSGLLPGEATVTADILSCRDPVVTYGYEVGVALLDSGG